MSRMEQKPEEVILGPEGASFLKSYLADGHRLANLLNRLDLSKGTVCVWVPAGTPMDQIVQFDSGGKLPRNPADRVQVVGGFAEPIPNYDNHLAIFVNQFLLHTKAGVCIFENALASPSDPYLKDAESTISTSGDEVYHVVTAIRPDREGIDVAIAEAKSIPIFVGALTTTGADCGPHLISGGEISESCLSGLASRAVAIIAGIYDGESYLIWRRADEGLGKEG